ncbi:ankyrin repeat family protein [Prunus dulcis]|uniref:Ankyrin repeat family protein n=1 Tax=Prunus dulcis TaxID=3755 RepID=A0A4Y1RNZ6_PRUDU|nr:ankyrin repeat family protein [Prunus dulcis]
MSVCVPRKLQNALSDPKWVDAMHFEMEALNKNAIWEICYIYEEVWRRKGKLTALIIYIDDMINLQKYLASKFEMKSLGDLKYFLGIEVARSKHGIFLSQRKYVLDLLAEMGMLDCRPIDNPSEQNHKLALSTTYGKLIYLAHTRPDIAYAVSVVSQFMHSPSEDHMGAVTRILRYLKVTPGNGLIFSKYGQTYVEGYTDADWAGSATDRCSTSRYFTFVGGNLVTWRSKKQKVVSRSSAVTEYRRMAHGVCELLWLRRLLRYLGFGPKKPMDLYCDNKAAIAIAHNHKSNFVLDLAKEEAQIRWACLNYKESSLFFLALSLPEIKSIIKVIAEELEAKAAAFGAHDDIYYLRESNKVLGPDEQLLFSFNYNWIFALSLAFNLTNLKSRGYPYEELSVQEKSRTTQEQGNSKLDFWKLHYQKQIFV